MTEPPAKKNKARAFQPSWTEDYGFVYVKDRAVCTLCYDNVVCRTSSIKRHFETKHDKTYKDPAERAEAVKRAVARYGKQSSSLKVFVNSQGHVTEASYNLASCIAKHGKPFTDGEYVKEAFLSCAETLFDDLPNKDTIKTRIKDMPTSARTVQRRIDEMAVDVRAQQTKGLTDASVFSLALDESVDVNDIPPFRSLLEEMDSEYADLPLHSAVRWLSCGKVLERFVSCIDAIKVFLAEKGQQYPQLEDEKWIVKLFFLADITGHLNELNLRLQGAGQTVMDMFETWTAFVAKLAVFSGDIASSTFRYFRHLREWSSQRNISTAEIAEYMRELETEFTNRFVDFKSSPLWVTKFAELRKQLESTPVQQHGSIALALLSVFGSTYLCEQVFSHMKSVLSPIRSRLTTDNSESCLQLKVTNYKPQIRKLSKEKQGQGSH
uniref:SPIN-DOC-like zinc-finger domain-containing protein n=1 Tax=Astyanax mexicanus TaxID=7994 RepID=A0A3B1J491_ASTMX